jgi:hypothetical protein
VWIKQFQDARKDVTDYEKSGCPIISRTGPNWEKATDKVRNYC